MLFRVLVTAVMFLGPQLLYSQEMQVAFDSAGTVFVIDLAMQRQHNILPVPVDGFIEARLFQSEAGEFWLEVVRTNHKGDRIRSREEFSGSNVQRVRLKLHDIQSGSTGTEQSLPELSALGRSDFYNGNTGLIVGTTFWGLVYGSYFTTAIGAGESAGYGALIGAGLGFAIPMIVSSNTSVNDASTELALGGLFQGLMHGLFITGLVFGEDAPDYKVPFAMTVGVGIAEATSGFFVAKNTGMSAGTAGAITSTSFIGALTAVQLSAVFLSVSDVSGDASIRLTTGLGLAGSVAGIVAGNILANHYRFSLADATAYMLTSFYAAALPYTIYESFVQDFEGFDSALLYGTGVLATIGGMWGGLEIVRSGDFLPSASTHMIVGSIAGCAAGLGILGLTGGEQSLLFPYLGSVGGFALGMAMSNRQHNGALLGKAEFDINPVAPLFAGRLGTHVPMVSALFRF